MKRCFTNILSENIERSALFYESLLGMKRHFDSDWFIILVHDELSAFEFGILKKNHEVVTAEIRSKPGGVLVTFVVEDCNEVFRQATSLGVDILEPPTDMPYGQKRMLLRDPDGVVIDISSPTILRPL